jgi:hypothetical protein
VTTYKEVSDDLLAYFSNNRGPADHYRTYGEYDLAVIESLAVLHHADIAVPPRIMEMVEQLCQASPRFEKFARRWI